MLASSWASDGLAAASRPASAPAAACSAAASDLDQAAARIAHVLAAPQAG